MQKIPAFVHRYSLSKIGMTERERTPFPRREESHCGSLFLIESISYEPV
jgi:hypothetical protein